MQLLRKKKYLKNPPDSPCSQSTIEQRINNACMRNQPVSPRKFIILKLSLPKRNEKIKVYFPPQTLPTSLGIDRNHKLLPQKQINQAIEAFLY